MRHPDFDINTLSEHLEGTPNTLAEGLESLYPGMDEDDLTKSDYAELDNLIFKCAQCEWWCESGEANENPTGDGDICNDCASENE